MEERHLVETLAERVREYCQALGTPWTYALHRNPYAVAGFFWGLPIPIAGSLLAHWVGGRAVPLSDPVFLVLAAHPLLFAVLFGAFGTIRERKERKIRGLILQLEALAQTDGLTGLINQHHFHQLLPQLASIGAKQGQASSLVMIDLDGLKALNDIHGHAQGDEVLRHVGALIRRHARQGDLAARTGGDEFAVYMPATAPAEAASVASRLCAEIAGSPCRRLDGRGGITVSVSIGVAPVAEPGRSYQEIMAAADKALYRAKAEGRNRVALG